MTLLNETSQEGAKESGGQEVFPSENHIFNLEGFIQTIDFVPTNKPRKFSDQFVLVTAGGSSRAYIYDRVGLAWKYWTLT